MWDGDGEVLCLGQWFFSLPSFCQSPRDKAGIGVLAEMMAEKFLSSTGWQQLETS